MNNFHVSVLLQEVIEYLNVKQNGKYIDATLGGGGHTFEIVKHGGRVLGIDVDEEAIKYVDSRIKDSITLVRGNFKDIKKIAEENGFERVDGILFDLGVSSHQFDEAEQGFSFQSDAPLDMRMDKSLSVTAKDLINGLTKRELHELFTKFGEEHFANRLANDIVAYRRVKAIETTKELAKLIEKTIGGRFRNNKKKIHPATKVFQALRIAVNDELNSLKDALPQAVELLANKGRLVVISFHSLEDRIVKQAFLQFGEQGLGKVVTDKPIVPTEEEIKQNRRSRSAKMRVFERAINI